MIQYTTIKTDRVVCEQAFTVRNADTGIPIRVPLSPTSQIDPLGTLVNVTVTGCELRIDQADDLFLVDLTLFIQKQIIIIQNGISKLGSELGYNAFYPGLPFTTCRPGNVAAELYQRLRCQVYMVEAVEDLNLNPISDTFDEALTVNIIIKIIFADQISVPVGPEPPPPVPSAALEALEILAGKIRAQIGDQLFKKQLLQQIAGVRSLLESRRVLEALVILNVVAAELQRIFNCSPSLRVRLSIVLADLSVVEKKLKVLF